LSFGKKKYFLGAKDLEKSGGQVILRSEKCRAKATKSEA
jgi:hypothetical protein